MSMRLRFVAVAVGTLLVLVGWFTLVYRPGSANLKEVKAKIVTTQTEIAALEAKLAELQELQRNEKTLRAQAATYARALPPLPALSTFIRQVQKIADESDVNWVSITPSTPQAAGSGGGTSGPAAQPSALRTISVSMSASGDFFEIERFIEKFERLDRAIRINTFSLGGVPGEINLATAMVMFMGGTTPESLAALPPSPAPGAPATGASPAPGATGPGVVDRTSQGVADPGV
jgi:Tfp pilus assembly protein PilO